MSKTTQQVIDFGNNQIEAARSSIPLERCAHGTPEQALWNHFQDSSKQMVSGLWECTEGKWEADYSAKNEFCHILSGKVVLADEAGNGKTFEAGDSFVIPVGFVGTWEVLEPVRKLYVIVTPNQA